MTGSSGDALLCGNLSNDSLDGGADDHSLVGDEGSDYLDGADGTFDVAVFDGEIAGYTVTESGGTANVGDIDTSNGDEGDDTVVNIRFLRFDDGDVILGSVPVAGAVSASRDEDTSVAADIATLVVAASDADGDSISFVSVGGAIDGSVVRSGDQLVFTPDADFNGTASFDCIIADAYGGETSPSPWRRSTMRPTPATTRWQWARAVLRPSTCWMTTVTGRTATPTAMRRL